MENLFPWFLVRRVGVRSTKALEQARSAIRTAAHQPTVKIKLIGNIDTRIVPMIRFKVGDVVAEDAEALVNTVNCVGAMGRGIALQFKRAFPENFRAYAEACKRGDVQPGRMLVFETGAPTTPRYIINFPTGVATVLQSLFLSADSRVTLDEALDITCRSRRT